MSQPVYITGWDADNTGQYKEWKSTKNQNNEKEPKNVHQSKKVSWSNNQIITQIIYSHHDITPSLRQVYEGLVAKGEIVPKEEVAPPTVPMDFNWARELGLIRKPASFMTSICDERGQELLYAGIPITDVFKDDMGVGGVLGLLWFQKR